MKYVKMLLYFKIEPNYIVAFYGISVTIFSVFVNVLGTSTAFVRMPLLSQRAAHSVVTHALPVNYKQVSSFVSTSVLSTMPPASSAEFPLVYTAVALLTMIHTASSVPFSIADDILLLHVFVRHEQNSLYSVTCCGGSRYRSSCFLHSIAKGDILFLLVVFLLALASNRSIREFCAAILLFILFLPNYLMLNTLKAS